MPRKRTCEKCVNSKLSLFDVLSPEQKQFMNETNVCYSFKKGEIIYKEGDKPVGLICLASGKAKIFTEGIGGREQIVRLAKPVGFIGFRALFAHDLYQSSAIALEDCTVCTIKRENIFSLLEQNSTLGINILAYMANELGQANRRTLSLTQKHLRGRLAESLLFIMETYGYEKDGETLDVYLSRDDLASLSNMTTSNAIRTLSSLAHEGVIKLAGRKIKIVDASGLKKVSECG